MIRRVVTGLVLGSALALSSAACGSSNSANPGPDPAVTWSEQVCKTVQAGGDKLSKVPQVDPSSPQKAKDSLLSYLGVLSDALQSVADGIKAAGAPPVADGQATVDKVIANIADAKQSVESARTKLQQAQVTDTASFQQTLGEIGAGMQKFQGAVGPTKDLRANGALNEAFGKAPTCQKLP